MCCIISGEPVDQAIAGRIKVFNGAAKFQVDMMHAPCVNCPSSGLWFCGQFFPLTCGCTQYELRRKALGYDMSKYTCCQGYFNTCGFQSGQCGEESCPDLCLLIEGTFCNFAAVSASRQFIMEKYDLQSDPCDYRLIRINNCLQMVACVFEMLAIVHSGFRDIATIINRIADLFYHTVSGCMTAQVAFEIDYQLQQTVMTGGQASQVSNYDKDVVVVAMPVSDYEKQQY